MNNFQNKYSIKTLLLIVVFSLFSIVNIYAQSDVYRYSQPAGFGLLRRQQQVMDYFTPTILNNFPGFVMYTRLVSPAGAPDNINITLVKVIGGAVSQSKRIDLSSQGIIQLCPIACAYNSVTKLYCVVGNGIGSTGFGGMVGWYIVLDQNLNILTKNVLRVNMTVPFVSTVTCITDICPVLASGVAPNVVTNGFAMTGVAADGPNLATDITALFTPANRFCFIAKLDAATGIVPIINNAATGGGIRVFNMHETAFTPANIVNPNRFTLPTRIIQVATGANTNGGYYITGTAPRITNGTVGVGASVLFSAINNSGAIMHVRRGYNLTVAGGLGGAITRRMQMGPVGTFASGIDGLWDPANNEIRCVGIEGTANMVVDKLTGVNAPGQPINIFTFSIPPFSMARLNFPNCGFSRASKMFQGANPNTAYGGGSARNTGITGVTFASAIACFPNAIETPWMTVFDYGALSTYNPATWAAQTFFNLNEIVFYPRTGAVVVPTVDGFGSGFQINNRTYQVRNSCQIPFATFSDEQYGLGGRYGAISASEDNVINYNDFFNNNNCNVQPDVFTPSVLAETFDLISPATVNGTTTVTNTNITNGPINVVRNLVTCSLSFFKSENNTTESVMLTPLSIKYDENNNIIINVNKEVSIINVYTMDGRLADHISINNSIRYNTNNLSNGVYIVRAIDKSGNLVDTKKVIVQ